MDWDPAQYGRFAAERRQPFLEVLRLLRPIAGGRLADLGCGNGSLTVEMKDALLADEALGLDRSPAMLADAPTEAAGVHFVEGDLATWDGDGSAWDLVAAHASLHWVPDHEGVLARWAGALRPGGQLAVQVPANADHPAHTTIDAVAAELGIDLPPDPLHNVLTPERYAEVLDDLGFERQHVRLQVFGHHLASSDDVVEWTKGTALLRVRRATDDAGFDAFLTRYRELLLERLGRRAPYFYAFKRILFVAQRRGGGPT